ncbi:DNA-directed RNA polymerase subunit omega [Clostridium aciditolerans]|jgi:DNA-directed RNA polymerase subunit omega|uniref:DNA-directed RNA polymerase subunit omega n=1 Tax=Clostridium aciditolerans TaxID=339861 RepID=A0A934I1F9_9CLOT|nr:DNA-directed RNA polymerase subunit omega [Clostridium aciditolerans]MBI6875062.1 DNA-directed RNA polymerase subunit omega [Clostridium aciditolerans]
MNNSMINPSIVELLKKVDNRYTLVTMTAKRARQLIQGEEPLVRTNSTKPVTISINEINQGAITYETIREGIK